MLSETTLGREILEQPEVLERLLTEERSTIDEIARVVRARAPRFIFIAARGSSDNAARYAQYLFGAKNRLPVALATPSLFTLYGSPPRLAEALVVAVSQSGQSPDIVAVMEEGRRQGALTAAVTNDPGSPLAGAAQHVVRLRAGPELSVAATKSYTASLMALALLSQSLNDDRAALRELERVPEQLREVLSTADAVRNVADRWRLIDSCVVVSRGFNRATAFEIALKLKELAHVVAEPYSSADFLHGPVALVERGFPVLAVLPEGAPSDELLRLLRKLGDEGADIVAISSLDEVRAFAPASVPLPKAIPEWLSPIVAVVPGQLLAAELARAKGLDPEKPRGLRKVTRTR